MWDLTRPAIGDKLNQINQIKVKEQLSWQLDDFKDTDLDDIAHELLNNDNYIWCFNILCACFFPCQIVVMKGVTSIWTGMQCCRSRVPWSTITTSQWRANVPNNSPTLGQAEHMQILPENPSLWPMTFCHQQLFCLGGAKSLMTGCTILDHN